ncbi:MULTISPECIES: hypothetical protein [unclassified Pseudomonas]|uniref:hypothetical protein n=1 Tax=unclassified Pseudomonas TaxID=196821 RepID=UPI0011993F97|nr:MULTISPECIES: hypothetical protein [unclassified Pseudomonas]TWC20536.1 hypothetical protein FBY00_104164 [Pseudomonas sp. SJZ075]TWC25584.1 hypothetical protein FBX99_101121 [Pseudomonas sp. SJZ074]TWC35966.1 hypothetical protein FBY02_104165 [Pseudomonas sp. SJZ078]TWC42395.1 hypothetical protein FBY06_101121 [Pseudomonas sp. SJZ085]TWC56834.1 hypothetical protein FBY11_104164 [Pseudomonas sp. SJZ124]
MTDLPKDLRYLPGADVLDLPMVMELSPESGNLDLPSVAESGAVVRIAVYPGMTTNDTVQLSWLGGNEASSYYAKSSVRDPERFLDFVVPKSVLRADPGTPPGTNFAHPDVSYQVFPASGENKESAVNSLYFHRSEISPNPPPEVPAATGGLFDPDKIPDPGLTIIFPRFVVLWARWTSYGRDGRVMYRERFGVGDDLSVVIFRPVLNLTEDGGEVRIVYYTGNDENILGTSLPAVLKVTRD